MIRKVDCSACQPPRLDLAVRDVSSFSSISDSELFYLPGSEYIKQLASVGLIDNTHTTANSPYRVPTELCMAHRTRQKMNSNSFTNCLTDLLLVNGAYDSVKRFISFQKSDTFLLLLFLLRLTKWLILYWKGKSRIVHVTRILTEKQNMSDSVISN